MAKRFCLPLFQQSRFRRIRERICQFLGLSCEGTFKDDAGNLSFVVYGDLLRAPRGIYADIFFFGLKYFLVARRHGVARFKAEHLNVRCAETVSIARAVYRNVTAADYHNITGE